MSTGIIAVCEINDGNGWRALPDIEGVQELVLHAGYNEYAILAGVRDRFGLKVFDPNGFPTDASARQFNWESATPNLKHGYESDEVSCIVFPNNADRKPIPVRDILRNDFAKHCVTAVSKEEYDALGDEGTETKRKHCHCSYPEDQYLIFDASRVGGRFVKMHYADIFPTFEEYAKTYFDEEWDDEAQDYGRWRADFDNEEFYDVSHRTLAELEAADYRKATGNAYKMDRSFYEAFIAAGGVFPNIFTVEENAESSDFLTAMQEVFCPTVMVRWNLPPEKLKNCCMFKILDELKATAERYGVSHDNIRIIYAFD